MIFWWNYLDEKYIQAKLTKIFQQLEWYQIMRSYSVCLPVEHLILEVGDVSINLQDIISTELKNQN